MRAPDQWGRCGRSASGSLKTSSSVSRSWRSLIEHPGVGLILIDTGFHRALAAGSPHERNRNLGPVGRLLARDVRMRPEQTVAAQLQARGIDPGEIRLIVMTHLHFDHASALVDFPDATVVLSRPEWGAARARGSSLLGYSTAQLDPGPSYCTIDFHTPPARPQGPFERTLDLLGDGSLVLLDTPGHSAGHLSIIARLREREALHGVNPSLDYTAGMILRVERSSVTVSRIPVVPVVALN
jgi:N-acyl homoserine lactone hydrolase